MKHYIFSTLLIILLSSSSLFAQFNLFVSYEGYYDDNIFNNYEQTKDFINTFSLETAYNVESELNNFQIYYQGEFSSFIKNDFKNSNSHKFGIVNTHLFSVDDNPLNMGVNFLLRNNSNGFDIYDLDQLSAYINYRHTVVENNYLLAGYVFYRNNFEKFPLFSHYENKFFARWISNFASGTTIIGSGELNLKNYFVKYKIPDYANDATLFIFTFNVGQMLTDRTRINAYVQLRENPASESRYFINREDFIFFEEEIFNDMYSNDGFTYGGALSHYFNEYVLVGIEGKYSTRNFTSLPVADTEGNSLDYLREDKQLAFGINANFDLSFMVNGLSLEAGWNYIQNTSNDYFYDYKNNLYAASISYGF
ncbi:MAG: hypothetical protein MUO34_10110 [Ignavibacteriaceae bacterium]|nr:hypothetical protein [Ignavibacteriaceae bacterium]